METKVLTKKAFLAEFAGNVTHAAEFIGVSRQAVRQWGDLVPKKHYIELAHLRPRKWGYLVRR
jgi:hypothetical protein